MKRTLKELLHNYLLIIIAFLPSVFLIRLAEFLSLQFLHAVPGNTWIMVLYGYLLDNLVFLSFSLLLVIPFFLLSLLSRRAGLIMVIIILLFYTLISLSLVKYFLTTLIPLDQVIFYYTTDEIVNIVLSSTRIDLPGLLAFLIIMSSPLILYFFIRKLSFNKVADYIFLAILIISPFLMKISIPDQANYQNDYDYFVRISKPIYLVSKIHSYKSGKSAPKVTDASFSAVIKRYQFSNPQFSYISQNYPLLRVDATPDVLGNYFSFGKEKPNLVFIIVESLSTSFCGDHPYYGSFMPFLDSLIGNSLYWSNFLSSAERTFNILPAVFGSLPYCDNVFCQSFSPPLHFSMIRYLKENGYNAHFFYGGDPRFGGYDRFMRHERIDYILSYFGKEYGNDIIREKKFEWGYPDSDLFKRTFEVLDSLDSNPRLDIYLTLSTHAPFTPPDEARYIQMYQERLKHLKLSSERRKMVEVQKNIFTSVIYADQSLRTFFNNYRKRKEFSNTIFFITGDHAMPELNFTYLNIIERYHVPFIIYSPLLNEPAHFRSVSSHLDITPSLLAMLKYAGFISTRQQCHWIGKGIDVTEQFRNNHALSFIFNNGLQEEYLEGQNYLSCGRLYRLQPDLDLTSVKDSSLTRKMKEQLDDYLLITKDILSRNEMIPEDLFFAGSYTESPYFGAEPATYNRTTSHDGYITIAPAHKINDDFQFMRLDLSMTMEMKSQDSLKFPVLIIQVLDEQIQNVAWFQFSFDPVDKSVKTHRYQVKKYLDLTNVHDLGSKTMKMYLSNPNNEQILMDDLRLEMKGFKENKNFIQK